MIRLRGLGGLELRGHEDEELPAILAQPKRLAVLFYLAMAVPFFRRRDTLLGVFWPETDQRHARSALNQTIYFLRRELGHRAVVSRGQEEVAVDPEVVWCDAPAFEAALDAGDRQEALELYRGELLPGYFLSDTPGWERWLEGERDRLRGRAAAAAWGAADEALMQEKPVEAARCAWQAAEISPFDEIQLRRLLTLLGKIGDRAGAARAFDEATARFAAEYGGKLSAQTRLLAERIQAGELEEANARGSEVGASTAGLASAGPPLTAAVLPLTGGAPDAADFDVADALTDGLIRRLSSLAGLGVIGRESVAQYRDARPAPDEIGRRLGAAYLIEGSVRPARLEEDKGPAPNPSSEPIDQRMRIDLRLLEAETGDTLWMKQYGAALADLSIVEGDVAVEVARKLSIEPDAAERERLRQAGTSDTAARREYLKGRYFLTKSDEASFRTALAHFRAALDRDPVYGEAWSGLSDAYDHLAGIGALPSTEAYPRARAAAERALEIDPDLAEAHTSLAMTLSHFYWQTDDAERHWRRALELKPNDARARRTYAGHLRNMGRFDEALVQATIARDLDPIPFTSQFELLFIPYLQRRYEHVIEGAEALAAADPAYGYAHFLRALALVHLERYDEASTALDAVDPGGDWADARLLRAYIAGRQGREPGARRELRSLEEDPSSGARGFERSLLHLALGEPDHAIAALEEAYEARSFRLRFVGFDPFFDPLHGDPRFEDLLERIRRGGTEAPRQTG